MSTPISIVIPCYHSAESIGGVLSDIETIMTNAGREFEVIAVNDGSHDDTQKVLNGINKPWLKSIELLRNFGQHGAVLCGIREAQHPITVTMDDDGQHPAEEMLTLIESFETSDCDVMYGYADSEKHSLWRVFAAGLTKLALARFMGSDTARRVTSFRAFRTELREAFENYSGSFVSIDVLLTWGTSKFEAIKIKHLTRELGESQYTFRKLSTHALNMVTGFSVIPLQIASLLGLLACILGALILVYLLVVYFIQGTEVKGFTFLACSIVLFGGIQLLALGIIGEYIARIHFRSMGKPPYVKRKSTESDQ